MSKVLLPPNSTEWHTIRTNLTIIMVATQDNGSVGGTSSRMKNGSEYGVVMDFKCNFIRFGYRQYRLCGKSARKHRRHHRWFIHQAYWD